MIREKSDTCFICAPSWETPSSHLNSDKTYPHLRCVNILLGCVSLLGFKNPLCLGQCWALHKYVFFQLREVLSPPSLSFLVVSFLLELLFQSLRELLASIYISWLAFLYPCFHFFLISFASWENILKFVLSITNFFAILILYVIIAANKDVSSVKTF